ncbi:MAG TPA: DegT/DnrJ/EryC1/StrS aminotransferase family protein, partial [Nitrospirae bacterium]|nr:DegT/DnrJ/EryC1/StrS aminotransferase family protein [Nitrospirota bacterium]
MDIPFIDLKAQYLRLQSEISSGIDKVFEHGQFIMGPEVFELERRLAKFAGVNRAVTCSSGTDALLMTLMALNVGRGDAATLSFFPAKPLGCYGDGGAVLTDDEDLAYEMESIRVHGQGDDKYSNSRIG